MIIEKSRIITTEKEEPEEETESPLLIELILKTTKNGMGDSLLCVALGGAISFSSGQPSHPEGWEGTTKRCRFRLAPFWRFLIDFEGS